MLARLDIPGAWMWSAWQPDRGIAFNSYLFEREGGCVAVDPLPLDDESIQHISKLGGVHTIVITNPDHERGARALRERFGARDAKVVAGEEAFAGARAIALPHGKTEDEIALYLDEHQAAVIGDALIGAPAGSLSLLPAEKLADRDRFVLTLRQLCGLQLRTLLLCDGQPLFGGADAAIGALLEREGGPGLHRVNIDEIEFRHRGAGGKWECYDGEAGLPLGSRDLGYRVVRIPAGKAFCPLHWHVRCEEFFYVIEGQPSVRTHKGKFECRPGDFIAFPKGESGAHQLLNESNEPALVMLVGMEDSAAGLEACYYPDSDKVGLWTAERALGLIRSSPKLDYYDGE
ncbi:MAG TPA: cupin domain-containing protein [Candidatus Baltobacteraceae bacterium]|jgi:uncharacterized cupin superfamily protein|nr:cupin domain-containing protein [Candidatus Baltobacteraceae bacterium]